MRVREVMNDGRVCLFPVLHLSNKIRMIEVGFFVVVVQISLIISFTFNEEQLNLFYCLWNPIQTTFL